MQRKRSLCLRKGATARSQYSWRLRICTVWTVRRHIAEEFERQKGTVVCRELLGIEKGEDLPEPAVRTEEYYQTRPCAGLCELAANILDEYSLSLSFSKQ